MYGNVKPQPINIFDDENALNMGYTVNRFKQNDNLGKGTVVCK